MKSYKLNGNEERIQRGNEWYTPPCYIEAARVVMGDIDLDPASCTEANKIVMARHYYTKEIDGLSQSWAYNTKPARIWCNPPYGKVGSSPGTGLSYQQLFVEKCVYEWACGHIEQAILLLLGNSCFARYFNPLWDHLVCIHDGGITFLKEGWYTERFGFGSLFVYLGPNTKKFIDVFSLYGRVVHAVGCEVAR